MRELLAELIVMVVFLVKWYFCDSFTELQSEGIQDHRNTQTKSHIQGNQS